MMTRFVTVDERAFFYKEKNAVCVKLEVTDNPSKNA
jgi:hypothetical protein